MIEHVKKTVISPLEEEKEGARRATGFSYSSGGADSAAGADYGLLHCNM